MQHYRNHHGHFIGVHLNEIKTKKYGKYAVAYVEVSTYIRGDKVYRSTCSVAGRSCRLARVAMKKELQRAMLAKDTPGFTH